MNITLAKNLELWPIEKLRPYERNSRTHSVEQIEQIAASILRFGFNNPILVDSTDGVIAGHGRLAAAQKLGLTEVPVVLLDHLSDQERRAYIIADNRLAELAGWDRVILSEELAALKEDDFELDVIGFSEEELERLEAMLPDEPLSSLDGNGEFREPDFGARGPYNKEVYTKKIQAPIYEPKGEKPELAELCDQTKTSSLLAEIEQSSLPEEVKAFLSLAAQRHLVFNYEKIAEFYAHASPEVQELMENSALVIIDFNKAIENGFVAMTKELAEAYTGDEQ